MEIRVKELISHELSRMDTNYSGIRRAEHEKITSNSWAIHDYSCENKRIYGIEKGNPRLLVLLTELDGGRAEVLLYKLAEERGVGEVEPLGNLLAGEGGGEQHRAHLLHQLVANPL